MDVLKLDETFLLRSNIDIGITPTSFQRLKVEMYFQYCIWARLLILKGPLSAPTKE